MPCFWCMRRRGHRGRSCARFRREDFSIEGDRADQGGAEVGGSSTVTASKNGAQPVLAVEM